MGNGEAKLMILVEPGIAKVIVSLPGFVLEFKIACRNEPGPLSAIVVTLNDGAIGPTEVDASGPSTVPLPSV